MNIFIRIHKSILFSYNFIGDSMKKETFKKAYYIVLSILILLFYTKDINMNDNKFYHNVKIVEKPESILVLVNKNNKLKRDYIPELVKLDTSYSNDNKYLRKEAKDAFEQLVKQAKKKKLSIKIVSAYRSYNYQETLFKNYIKEYSKKYALNCSAKAGHSEHQTGLAIDVMGSNKDYNLFEETEEFKWMKDNAYKYGFILRYPKGKENITGFKYEPWHYRYVGKDIAEQIHNKNITLEEYFKERN